LSRRPEATTPLGLLNLSRSITQGSLALLRQSPFAKKRFGGLDALRRGGQPWAGGRNPFGIGNARDVQRFFWVALLAGLTISCQGHEGCGIFGHGHEQAAPSGRPASFVCQGHSADARRDVLRMSWPGEAKRADCGWTQKAGPLSRAATPARC